MPAENLLKKIFSNLKLCAWISSGKEKNSREKLTIFYAGSEYTKKYFYALIYDNCRCEEEYLGEKWFWDVSGVSIDSKRKVDLIIIESCYRLCRFFSKKNDFIIPVWISVLADVSTVKTSFLKNKSLKNDTRRCNKNKLYCYISNEDVLFDNFYFDMYQPYIKKVYGDTAVIDEYSCLKKKFHNNGALAIIKKNKETLGGYLLLCSGKTGIMFRMGIMDGRGDFVKEGAIQALYHFSLTWFEEKGCRKVDLGPCRAFLNDGVLRFKKKFSPQITYREWRHKAVLMKFLSNVSGVRAFLINNPFVFIKNNRLNAAIFIEESCFPPEKNPAKISKRYCFAGIADTNFFQQKSIAGKNKQR